MNPSKPIFKSLLHLHTIITDEELVQITTVSSTVAKINSTTPPPDLTNVVTTSTKGALYIYFFSFKYQILSCQIFHYSIFCYCLDADLPQVNDETSTESNVLPEDTDEAREIEYKGNIFDIIQ